MIMASHRTFDACRMCRAVKPPFTVSGTTVTRASPRFRDRHQPKLQLGSSHVRDRGILQLQLFTDPGPYTLTYGSDLSPSYLASYWESKVRVHVKALVVMVVVTHFITQHHSTVRSDRYPGLPCDLIKTVVDND